MQHRRNKGGRKNENTYFLINILNDSKMQKNGGHYEKNYNKGIGTDS